MEPDRLDNADDAAADPAGLTQPASVAALLPGGGPAPRAGAILADLSATERLVCTAFPRGSWVDLRDAPVPAGGGISGLSPEGQEPGSMVPEDASAFGPDRVVRAEVIMALLQGAFSPEPGYTPAIRLRGAKITGRLDLMGATVSWPLVCEYCYFDTVIRMVEATTKTVRMVSCFMPAFNGTRMRLDGILNLSQSRIAGVLRIEQARITGHVSMVGTRVVAPTPDGQAVSAIGISIDGSLECTGLHASGSVTIETARITGSVGFSAATISCPGGRALTISHAEIGKLDCGAATFDGQLRMNNCRIGASLSLSAAVLRRPGAIAMSAGGLTVQGGVFADGTFRAEGEVQLVGARLAANLTLAGAVLSNPDGIALNLDRAGIGNVDADGMTCTGRVSMIGARLAASLSMRDAEITGDPGGAALVADSANIEAEMMLAGLQANGEVSMRTTTVGRRVLLLRARLATPGGTALRMSGSQVAADMFCDGMTVDGRVRLAGARFGGQVSLRGITLHNPDGHALEAPAIQANELVLQPADEIEGVVELSHARLELLRDWPLLWPADLRLDGLTYGTLEPRLGAKYRLRWLARDPTGYQAQPYLQLAAYYTAIGQTSQARAVQYERERLEHRSATWLARAWGSVQDVTVGYGYRPWRALVWLAVLLATGTVVFSMHHPHPYHPHPPFIAFVYTLDLMLPVVSLGEKGAFNPTGYEQWLSYLLIASGWLLVTTVATAAARALSRN
jgi:hypothetical protein